MQKTIIPYREAGLFNKLFLQYAGKDTRGTLNDFYTYEPDADGVKKFISENTYTSLDRDVLVSELLTQSKLVNNTSEQSLQNIRLLSDSHTYTVTTGHQLCLATGPLYFIYKIISVINTCEKLNKEIGTHRFVPAYWMATEDHDVEEINHVYLFGKKITWNTQQKGKAGEFELEDIGPFLDELKQVLGDSAQAKSLFESIHKAYSHQNLADATRHLVNEWFGKYGLIVVDGNSEVFKKMFIPEMEEDIFKGTAYKKVVSATQALQQSGYATQVSPREINLFYTGEGMRERLVKENGRYKVLNTDISFNEDELKAQVRERTNKFSPNVVLRPLYQQKILPNVIYMGGPAEVCYWMQYKTMFNAIDIPYPLLMPRNFILYVTKNIQQRMEKLGLDTRQFLGDKNTVVKDYALTPHPFDIREQKDVLKKLFEGIKVPVSEIDKSLEASVEAEFQKALKGLETIEQKTIRSIKQKNEQGIRQIESIFDYFFPGGSIQERTDNVLRYALQSPGFIEEIKNNTLSFIEEEGLLILKED